MNLSKKRGCIGEDIAYKYLKSMKYNCLSRNYHSRYGEIDIIFEDSSYIVFGEVKMRRIDRILCGIEAVTPKKIRNIILTAYTYLEKYEIIKQPRFDIIAIGFDNRTGDRVINHIRNAFGEEHNAFF